MDTVFVEGLEFEGNHGHFDSERELGNRFIVDLALHLDISTAAQADDLSKTADYSAAAAIAQQVFDGPPVHLVETLAETLAARLLESLPIRTVEVRIAKLDPPMDPPAALAGVRITREKR